MAGMNAAARASEAEASVAVIERDRVGGTCPIRGCIPSKALIRSAEIAHEVRTAARYGVRVGRRLGGHGRGHRPGAGDRRQGRVGRPQVARVAAGRAVSWGEARFEEPGVVTVDGDRLRAPRVVIASGAAPRPLPVPGLDEAGYLTSDDVLRMASLPERLLVIGAGPVGLELGQALGRLGSRVTMVEMTDAAAAVGRARGRRDAGRSVGRGGDRAVDRRRDRARRDAPRRRPADSSSSTRAARASSTATRSCSAPAAARRSSRCGSRPPASRAAPRASRSTPAWPPRATATSRPATCSARPSTPSRPRPGAWGARRSTTRWTSTPMTSAATSARRRSSPTPRR